MSNKIQVEDKYFDFVCQLLERLSIKFAVIYSTEEELIRTDKELRKKEISKRVGKSFEKMNISPVNKLTSNQSKKKK